MKIYAAQDQLAKALTSVSRVIMSQNNMPILAGIQLRAQNDTLRLTATDLFTTLKSEIVVDVESPGEVVIPATLLTDLVHRIPTATVEIHTDDTSGKTMIKYGKNHATLLGFGAERLPEFTPLEGARHTFSLPAGVLGKLTRELLFACAKDEARPVLRGVFIHLESGRLTLVATDGSRLSYTESDIPDYQGGSPSCIVPAKILAEGARLNALDDAEMTIGPNMFEIRTASSVIVSRLLDGKYPDYQRVIPSDYVAEGRVRVADFRGALERANLLASRDHTSSVRIKHESGRLEISASAQEVGQSVESVEFDSQGEELDMLFNPTYLLDALKSLDGEDAILEFSGVQSPLRIRNGSHDSYSHILLPLRQLV